MGKRDILANILIKSGAVHILQKLRPVLKKELIVLAYHRISDIKSETQDYPYDIEVIDASVDEFDKQMQFIKHNYNPVSIEDLQNHIDNKQALPKNPIMITFDDGFNDNYHNAHPILKKHNIPASIFIATDHIETKKPFWFERLSRLILTTKQNKLSIADINYHCQLPESKHERRAIYEECVEKLKYIGRSPCLNIINKLERLHGIDTEDSEVGLSTPLTWQQCKEMVDSTFTIGSHGTSHTIFTQLNDKELQEELSISKQTIEEKISTPVTALSFPNGQAADFDQRVIKALKKQNYKIFFSYLHGTNKYSDIGEHALRRIHPPRKKLPYFKLALSLPEIF